jgi:hypothetical protein
MKLDYKTLDAALNKLPIDGGLMLVEEESRQDEVNEIYGYLRDSGYVETRESNENGVFAALLTSKGICLINEGGFKKLYADQIEKKNDRNTEINIQKKSLKWQIITAILTLVGGAIGYVLGKLF